MNSFELLGLDKNFKLEELDKNYKYLVDLMAPYIDDGGNEYVYRFIDIDLAHDALKNNVEKYKLLSTFNNSDFERISANSIKFAHVKSIIKNLESNVGKLVNVTYNKNGEIKTLSGCLESVHGFNFIKLLRQPNIYYLNFEEAIMNITDSENETIFTNQFIGNDYNITSEEEVKKLYNQLWGKTLGLIYYGINRINNREVVNNIEVGYKLSKNKK